MVKNHLNVSTDQRIVNPVIFQIRRLVEIFNEYPNNVELLKANIKQLLFETSTYKISIEEQNPPEEIFQQNQDVFISYHGTLLLKIDNIQSKLSE